MVDIVVKDVYKNKSETVRFYSSWNEIPLKHLLYIGEYWQVWKQLLSSNVSLLRTKALLFVRLVETKDVGRRNLVRQILQSNNESLFELSELTNFIFTTNDLTTPPIPFVKKGFRKLYCPSKKLGNITAFEFAFADAFHIKYLKSGNETDLNNFLGSLFRPKKWFSDERVRFDKSNIEKYAKRLNKLKYAEKQVILLWYIGCRDAIVKANKNLFYSSGASSNDSTWIDLFLEMAGSKFGNFEQTGNTEMFLILKDLQHSAAKAAKNKQK